MKPYLFFAFVFSLFSCLFFSCNKHPKAYIEPGYLPVYMSKAEVQDVRSMVPDTIRQPGKVQYSSTHIYINEVGKGIHVLDNTDPTNPSPVAFIRIPGNYDLLLNQNVLYVDNARDMLILDISNPLEVRLLKRLPDVFSLQDYPPETNVVYECVDASKGIVVAWEKTLIANPQCYR